MERILAFQQQKVVDQVPSRRRACARTPLLLGIRSSACTSGTSRCRLRVNAALLKERYISCTPSRK